MNTFNYNSAIDKLVFYRRMAVLAERGTTTYTTYIDKLEAGTSIPDIEADAWSLARRYEKEREIG